MNADYLTKGLARVKFNSNRFRVQGWWRHNSTILHIITYLHIMKSYHLTIIEIVKRRVSVLTAHDWFDYNLRVASNLESICQTREWSSTKTLSILFSHIICSKRQFYNWERSFIFICYVSKQHCTEHKHMRNVYPILHHVTIFNDYHNISVTSTTPYILPFICTEWYKKATMFHLLNTKSQFYVHQTTTF